MTKPWTDLTPRERDCLVAEKVMSIKVIDLGDGILYYNAPIGTCSFYCKNHQHMLPEYSTDINAAWDVVEKMRNILGQDIQSFSLWTTTTGTYGAHFKLGINNSFGDTAPLAICLAALKAMGVEI